MHRGLYRPEMKMPEPTISAVILFDTCPETKVVGDHFEKHIWPSYRFNSCIIDGHFVPVPGGMDRSYHLAEVSCANEDDVHAYAQKVMSDPLDHKRPLWSVTVLRSKAGRSGVLIRIHHTISDGLGLLFSFLPLMEVEGGDPLSKIPLPGLLTGRKSQASNEQKLKKTGSSKTPFSTISGSVAGVLTALFVGCQAGVLAGLLAGFLAGWREPQGRHVLHPDPGPVVQFVRGVLSLLVMNPDSDFKMNPLAPRTPCLPYTGAHRYTRFPPVSMSAVKAVREKHGCTVNDAIMAALAGALRKYGAEDLKDPLLLSSHSGKLECKAFMLLGLPRPISDKDSSVSTVNNILTPVFRIPIGEPTAGGRLRQTVAMCNDLKSMAYILGIKLTTKFITQVAPTSVMRSIASEAISKGSANITCLPLTQTAFSIFGQEAKEVQCIFVNNIPQISALTYNGQVYSNIVCDPLLIPNAKALGQHFLAEFDALAQAA